MSYLGHVWLFFHVLSSSSMDIDGKLQGRLSNIVWKVDVCTMLHQDIHYIEILKEYGCSKRTGSKFAINYIHITASL